jgi:hypothetical protein
MKTIDKLEREYRDQTPIWWYTYEGFLYPMLSRALRTTDVDIIIKMGFFIGNLHRPITQGTIRWPSSRQNLYGLSWPRLIQDRF